MRATEREYQTFSEWEWGVFDWLLNKPKFVSRGEVVWTFTHIVFGDVIQSLKGTDNDCYECEENIDNLIEYVKNNFYIT